MVTTHDLGRGRKLRRFALATLAYTLLVVLFGAVVRMTGSGSGCGEKWPHCPEPAAGDGIARAIELSHRITSGLSFLMVVALAWAAHRWMPRGHLSRKAATTSVGLMVMEVAIGAVLVLAALVGSDDSVVRAIVMPAHLVNTSLLTGTLAVTAWGATSSRPVLRLPVDRKTWWGVVALTSILVTSATGALTALADTLYPLSTGEVLGHISGGIRRTAHFLHQLRLLHPVVAIAASTIVLAAAAGSADRQQSASWRHWGRAAMTLVLAQLLVGFVNIWLSTPPWVQVLHLALAQGLWLVLVMLVVDTAQQNMSRRDP